MALLEPWFAIEGANFQFNCTVEGSSEPVQSFNWYHNGSLVDLQDLRISTRMSNDWSWSEVLSVLSAERGDGGEYYCEAVLADANKKSNHYVLQINGDGTNLRGAVLCLNSVH
jgi:hypothetical protein